MTNGDDRLTPTDHRTTVFKEMRKRVDEIKRMGPNEKKRAIEGLAVDLGKVNFPLPPVLPGEAVSNSLFSPKSECMQPAPRFGRSCMNAFRVVPQDIPRLVDRTLPRLETESQVNSFLDDLKDYLK